MYGFDKFVWECFVIMVKDYFSFNFGNSFFWDKSVVDLILEKFLVLVLLGLWLIILVYLIFILFGICKVVKYGIFFDIWFSFIVIIGNVIFFFLFVIFLIIVFVGGSNFNWFFLRGFILFNFDDFMLG